MPLGLNFFRKDTLVRIFWVTLFSALIFVVKNPFPWPYYCCFFLCAIFVRQRIYVLGFFAFVTGLAGTFFHPEKLPTSNFGLLPLSVWQTAACFVFSLVYFYSFSFCAIGKRRQIWLPFLLILFQFMISALFQFDFFHNPWAMGFYRFSSLMFWFNVFYVISLRGEKPKIMNFLCSQPIFWTVSSTPVPALLHLYLSEKSCDQKSFVDTQKSGIRLLLWSCLLLIVIGLMKDFSHRHILVRMMMDRELGPSFGLTKNTKVALSVAEAWAVVMGSFFYFVLEHTMTFGFMVASCRACGIPVFRNVYRPFESKNLYSLFARLNYHYNQIILSVFVPPFSRVFSRIKHFKFRNFLIFSLSIYFSGFVFHYLTLTGYLFRQGMPQLVLNLGLISLYWILIAVFSTLSLFYERGPRVDNSIFRRGLRLCGYVIFYALIYILIKEYGQSPASFTERIRFLRQLIP